MTVAQRSFDIPCGSTVQFVVDVVGGPEDLTGYTGEMQIREQRNDVLPLATVPPGGIVTNPGTRQVTVTIPSSETENYTFSRGVYDVLLTGPGGDAWRLVQGRVTTSQAVTRED